MALPVGVRQGLRLPICAPDGHHWVNGLYDAAWLVCETCGVFAVCKGCLWRRHEDVARLPDVFCPAHADDAIQAAQQVVSYQDLAARVVYLAGSIPRAMWHLAPDRRTEHARVVYATYTVQVTHASTHNAWQVLVYAPGQAAPVLAAHGRADALVVQHVQPGVWVNHLRRAVT
jgi:hypothetical protein